MARGKPSPEAPGLSTTRQMLDELDALMERMLSLPVNDAEAPPLAALPPSAPLTAKLTLLQVPADDPPLDPPHPGPNPSHLPALAPSLAPPPSIFTDRVLPPVFVQGSEPAPAPPESADAFESWFILPLLWGNRLFDQGTLLLGESGGWLRSPGGRLALGVTGLVLLATACWWAMRDWLGVSW